jgi:hypothetical protein
MTTCTRSALRLLALAVVVTVGLGLADRAIAQTDPRFREYADEKWIATQIREALPGAKRGYQMLSASREPDQVDAALKILFDSYRYLRAAQAGSEMVAQKAKFPDPLIQFRIERLDMIRGRLRKCVDSKERLHDPGENQTRQDCLDGLPDGIRQLEVLTVILP